LAQIINSKLADDFDAPKLKETLSKYKRPENCEQMYVPKVNQEIWHNMKPFAKKADIKMANLQATLIKKLSGQANATNTLSECRESKTIPDYRAIVPQLIDTTALFGHLCKELSYKCKDAIRPILHPDFKPLCSRTHKVGPLLFGEDLANEAQNIKTSSKTVLSLTSNSGPNSYTKRFPASPSQYQANRPFLSQRGRTHFPPRRP
jgi:hypothetical protein